jgi:Tfp pilus assembly protein PilN
MVQINLLPDVKVEFVKARRLKRTIILVCALISGLALAVFILLFVTVTVVQKQHLSNLEEDIKTYTDQLESTPDIAKILTIQNQLNSLTKLHDDKPVTSRIFTYIKQLAPTEASVDTLTVDFDGQTMTISGKATNLAAVNKFTDTLKFTSFSVESDEQTDNKPAFSAVTLKQFSVDASAAAAGKSASYTLEFKYAPEIFSSEGNVKLTIPNQVTTRSETEKPSNVFSEPTNTDGGAQ